MADSLLGVVPTLLGGVILIGATSIMLDKTLTKDSFGSMEKGKVKSVLEEAGI